MIAFAALLALLSAESLGVYTLAELIAGAYGSGGAIGWWAFLLVGFAGYGTPRVADALGLAERRAGSASAVSGLVLIFILVRITYGGAPWDFHWLTAFIADANTGSRSGGYAILGAILLGITWLRGASRSTDGVDMQLLPRELGFSLAAVTALIVVGAMASRGGEVGRAGAAFYAMAVIALACSQLALSGASLEDREAGEILGTLLGGTALVVVAALAVVTVILGLLGPLIGPPLGSAINLILTIVLTPFAWAMEHLFRALIGNHVEWPKLDPSSLSPAGDVKPGQESEHNPVETGGLVLLRAVLIFAIALGAYGVFRWVTRLRQRGASARSEHLEVAGSGSLRDDIGDVFRGLFRRPRHERPPSARSDRVGRLYRDVLDHSERAGRPRTPSLTPSEFAPELRQAFQAPVTDEITRAFEHARYAGRDPDPALVEELERRWKTVR